MPKTEELSGLALREAAYGAIGVKVAKEQDGRFAGFFRLLFPNGEGMAPAEKTKDECWRNAPRIESSIAAAWPLLELWLKSQSVMRRFDCVLDDHIDRWFCRARLHLTDNGTKTAQGEAVEPTIEAAMATAICRVLVQAAGKTAASVEESMGM